MQSMVRCTLVLAYSCFVSSFAGLPFIEANRSDFPQPAPPDTNAADVLHNRGKITAVVHLPNCTLEGDLSEINKINLASNGWETCFFKAGKRKPHYISNLCPYDSLCIISFSQ